VPSTSRKLATWSTPSAIEAWKIPEAREVTTQRLKARVHEKSFRWRSVRRSSAAASTGRSQQPHRRFGSKAASMRGSCWCAALFQLTKTLLVRLAARVMMSAGSAAPRLPNAGRKLEH
jgi:hypothetical protein